MFFIHLSKSLFAIALLSAASSVSANDCGWSELTDQQKEMLDKGETTIAADFSKGNSLFIIDQFGFVKNESLFNSVANVYNMSSTQEGIADITLSDGEVASNNPALYDVIPTDSNPFGDLYQPFTLAISVHPDRDAYKMQVNYLTSPTLIKHVLNNLCFTKVGQKVLLRLHSTVVGNPQIDLDTPGFGPRERMGLWRAVFQKDVARASQPGNSERRANLTNALLGNANN